MSSASVPPPRTSSTSSSRHSLFWPFLIYLVSATLLSIYHVMSLETQLDEVTRANDKLDLAVKHAKYEQDKFYAFARDLVRLAPTNAAAAQIVEQEGLHRLQQTQPVLMSLQNPPGFTNAAPADPATLALTPGGTNSAAPAPPAK